jgi:Kef-type K+ transport system membrane component KefB
MFDISLVFIELGANADSLGAFRAGAALVARGEFSIVIAGLGVASRLEPQLVPCRPHMFYSWRSSDLFWHVLSNQL